MRLDKYTKESIYRSIKNDIPRPKNKVEDLQAMVVKSMSAPVKSLYKKSPDALRTASFGAHEYHTDRYVEIVVGDVDHKVVLAPAKEAIKKYNDTCRQLEVAIMSCSSLASLKRLLPEFISYFPTEEQPSKNLPAVANLMADLTKLGFPAKGKK